MDLTTLRSAVTLLSFLVFVGIVYWALSAKNKARFDEAANLPFLDDDTELPTSSITSDSANNLKKANK
ncbi:MAG: cbb3-type cytochrome c oxidase subunit 3 [Aeromicrobium sp.]|nr:cbb3-type cytochrome c oxidase subunit 3 [Burkholderiales bacterium]